MVHFGSSDERIRWTEGGIDKARDRELVLRSSTGAKIANVFSGAKHCRRCNLSGLRHLSGNHLEVTLDPSHAGNFDLSILCDPEHSGHIGKTVSVRDRIALRIVKKNREGYAELTNERGRILRIVLRNAKKLHIFLAVGFKEALEERKGILAGRAGNFEKCQLHRAVGKFIAQHQSLAIERFQFKFWGLRARGQCCHASSSSSSSRKNILQPAHMPSALF